MLSSHQRITWHRNIAENFNRLSRVHERYRRQTDRRQTDGRTTTYSEHEHKFTFAKKYGCDWFHHTLCLKFIGSICSFFKYELYRNFYFVQLQCNWVPIIYAQYLYWYLDHWYWYWYWYIVCWVLDTRLLISTTAFTHTTSTYVDGRNMLHNELGSLLLRCRP